MRKYINAHKVFVLDDYALDTEACQEYFNDMVLVLRVIVVLILGFLAGVAFYVYIYRNIQRGGK